MIANRLLAQGRQRRVVQCQVGGNEFRHLVLDRGLVLSSWRNDRRGPHEAVIADWVAVIQHPAQRCAHAGPDGGTCWDIDERPRRPFVLGDDA